MESVSKKSLEGSHVHLSASLAPGPCNFNSEKLPTPSHVKNLLSEIKSGTNTTNESYSVGSVKLNGVELVTLEMDGEDRVCLAQLSNALLGDYSYNEIHNRRVALGITCVQCTPVQLEVFRRAGAMPLSSRRCGLITLREAERLCKSFFNEIVAPALPEDFIFNVYHQCGWGCDGYFTPSRYNSSRAKCIRCAHCNIMFSPNKFIFHCHKTPQATYVHPDAANFNSWRRHIELRTEARNKQVQYAWEDVKALFNGGSRKRVLPNQSESTSSSSQRKSTSISGGISLSTNDSQLRKNLPNHFASSLFPASTSSVMNHLALPPHGSSNDFSHPELRLPSGAADIPLWMKGPSQAMLTSMLMRGNLMLPPGAWMNPSVLSAAQSSWPTDFHSTIQAAANYFSPDGNTRSMQSRLSIKRPWLSQDSHSKDFGEHL